MKFKYDKLTLIIFVGLFISSIFISWCIGKLFSHSLPNLSSKIIKSSTVPKVSKQIWTCSMHPQIRKNKKGRCPICAMNLIPVHEAENNHYSNSTRELKLSKKAEKLADIQVSLVIRDFAIETLFLSGKLLVDETKTKTISAWFPSLS